MDNIQKSTQLHETITKKFQDQGLDQEAIKLKLKEIDTFIYDFVVQEHINNLDETTYNAFKKCVESHGTDEEIVKILNINPSDLQEKALKKLEEYTI